MKKKTVFIVNNLFSTDPSFWQRKSTGAKEKLLQIIDAQTVYSHNLGLVITITESVFLKVKEKSQVTVQDTSPTRQTSLLFSSQTLFLKQISSLRNIFLVA